jgi:imidazoleglycerol-phosphate dehydratase
MRKGLIKRTTKETAIEVELDLDGRGTADISTGIGFLDHMLELLARHARMDLTVKAKGDLHIDHHHTTEDVGIALGQALRRALGEMRGITRFADVHMPMDETLTRVALDISGRPLLVFNAEFTRDKVGSFDTELVEEWFRAFAVNSGLTVHVTTLYGSNDHHIAESCFKGLARALRVATALDARALDEIPSTKGSLRN